jgi:hypothetical protein
MVSINKKAPFSEMNTDSGMIVTEMTWHSPLSETLNCFIIGAVYVVLGNKKRAENRG